MDLQKYTAMSLTAFALASCNAEPRATDFEVEMTVNNLKAAGFPESEIEVTADNVVIAGGDAVVTAQAAREMVMEYTNRKQSEQYRTFNLVDSSVQTICVDGSRLTNGALSTSLDTAINTYNAEGLNFTMVRTNGSNAGCDAEIIARQISGSGGSAGFPSGGLPFGEINLGVGLDQFAPSVIAHVTTHELGHCIGFRHSDYFNRSISCGSGGNEGSAGVGAVLIPNTPSGATFDGSVMNSCFNSGSTGQWTSSDVTALNELYGAGAPPPPPPPPPSEDPNSCIETNSCGGQAPGGCYCDFFCRFFGDCCSDRRRC